MAMRFDVSDKRRDFCRVREQRVHDDDSAWQGIFLASIADATKERQA